MYLFIKIHEKILQLSLVIRCDINSFEFYGTPVSTLSVHVLLNTNKVHTSFYYHVKLIINISSHGIH